MAQDQRDGGGAGGAQALRLFPPRMTRSQPQLATAYAPGAIAPTVRRATMGHIAFGISPFDPDRVKAELEKRHLNARQDTGAIASSPAAEKDIHTASYKSYHTTTPNGYDLQISNHISGNLPITTG